VGVGVGDGLGLADVLASGVGLLVSDGVGLADGVALTLACTVALGVGLDVAEGLGDAPGRCRMTTASKVAVSCCPFRADALTVAAGRLAHVVAALRRSFRYA